MSKAIGKSDKAQPGVGTGKMTDAEAADVTGGATSAPSGSSGTPIGKPILKPIVPRFVEPCL